MSIEDDVEVLRELDRLRKRWRAAADQHVQEGREMNHEIERYVGELRELREYRLKHRFDFELGAIAGVALVLVIWLIGWALNA